MQTEDTLFEIDNIDIAYGFRSAVKGLTLSLRKGTSLGLLGPNGAGKTSTIKALLGMLKPRRGTVSIFGLRAGNIRTYRNLGFAPEDGIPPEYMTGEEYLSFVGSFRKIDRPSLRIQINELLNWFDLTPEKKIHTYSKGMKRRLVLAQALLGEPELLILDEPLNGLDPLLIIKLREKLQKYHQNGGSILYSSHILSEIEKTCTDAAILRDGKLVAHSSVASLVKEFGSVESAFATKMVQN